MGLGLSWPAGLFGVAAAEDVLTPGASARAPSRSRLIKITWERNYDIVRTMIIGLGWVGAGDAGWGHPAYKVTGRGAGARPPGKGAGYGPIQANQG
jgi:hypothetical protein